MEHFIVDISCNESLPCEATSNGTVPTQVRILFVFVVWQLTALKRMLFLFIMFFD